MRIKFITYAKFIKYIKPYIFLESILLILLLITSIASLASPYFLKIIIDEVFPSKNYLHLIKVVVLLMMIYVIRIIASIISDVVYSKLSSRVVADIRKDLFAHLLTLPLSFYGKHSVGDLVHRINNEVDNIQDVLTNSIIRFVNTILSIIGIIIALSLLNFKLLIISCLVLPVIFLIINYFTPRLSKLYEKIQHEEGKLQGYFNERFSSILLIKIMNAFSYELRNLNNILLSLIRIRVKATRLSSTNRNVTTFLIAIGPLIVFLWGGEDVLAGTMTLGALVAFIQYQNRLYSPFMDLMYLYNDIIRTTVSMDRIFELFKYTKQAETNQPLGEELKKIKFSNVSFRYEETNDYVLKDLNFELKAGFVYGIKGASGSGKSTLIKLLCQYYSPSKGEIFINDTNLNQIGNAHWISTIYLASQETFIFNESLRYNVNYSMEETSDMEIINACEKSGLKTLIENLPLGIDTNLGERGGIFSGGQKQRVAFARLFLNLHHSLIILDEATSALDHETEQTILETLIKAKPPKCILIIISHRQSTFSKVDEIIRV